MLTWPVIPLAVGAGLGLAASGVNLASVIIRAASVTPALPITAERVKRQGSIALDIVKGMIDPLLLP
jgi:hypothetical protein